MVVQGLVLYYTMRCNAACAHCGVWSSPDRQERMSLPQAKRYIDMLAARGRAKVVVFVGGEPLLHLDDICTLVAYTRSFGIATQVSTNAFWAATPASARRTVERLADAGLDHLALSADAYHTEFIDPMNVGRAFAAAKQVGLIRKLQVIRSREHEEGDDLLAATGIDPAEVIDHVVFKLNRYNPEFDARKYIILNRHSVAPFGRAAFLKGHVALKGLDELDDVPCFMVRKFPIVYPDGTFYTCCCTAGFFDEYRVGNLETDSLATLDERMAGNEVYEAISKVGPVRLAKAMHAACGAPSQGRFANPCHACRDLLSRSDPAQLASSAKSVVFLHKLLSGDSAETPFDELV
jgi:MoaA/NifB/PqqE/SkfB family radical SAM enzyme